MTITYSQFRALLGIEADDNWLGGAEYTHSTPPYRIVGNKEVRAVPLGYIVDRIPSDFIRPLKHDPLYRENDLSTAEWAEIRPYCDDPEIPLLTFPASRETVCNFLRQADLEWMVRDEAWMAQDLTGEPGLIEASPDAVATLKAPKALTTRDMARAFADIGGWGFWQWKKNLADPPNWLKPARINGGGPPHQNRWNPVKIGVALMTKGKAEVKELTLRFQNSAKLEPWRDAWASYGDF